MAQTFLNLAQGVTGTLPKSNYVDSGKTLQVVKSTVTTSQEETTSTTATEIDTDLRCTLTPASSS